MADTRGIGSLLDQIFVSSISSIHELRSCPSIDTVRHNHHVKDQNPNVVKRDLERFLGDFSLAIPFFDIWVFLDSHIGREASSHATSIE